MRTILVIEDEMNVQKLMKTNLIASGYHVLIANDGEEGMRLITHEHPGLVFLDLRLPGILGWDVLKEITSRPEFAGIPVVIITASMHSDGEEKARILGAADFIVKPFAVDKLLDTAKKFLGE